MVQGNLVVVESGNDSASFSGNVKDTASLLVMGYAPLLELTNSKERYNVPGFDFRDYPRVYIEHEYGDFGPLTWEAPISVVTWNPGPGQHALNERDRMYGSCVYLMLRF